MEINFKASLINKPTVMKKNWLSCKYSPKEVAFVKLDTQSMTDVNTLKKLKNIWPLTFVSNILRDISLNSDLVNVYALTLQKDSFEKLEPDEFLGVAEITNEDNEVCLEYLQTNPQYMYDEDMTERKFKGVGKTILDSIKNLQHIKTIIVHPLFSVISFYEDNGFLMGKNESTMIWKKD